MLNLRWIGYHNFPFFNEKFSVSSFYDTVMAHIPCLNKEYLIHLKLIKYNGISLDEWIIFDASLSSDLVEVTELYSYILHSINKCNILNENTASSVIFEYDTDDSFDKEINKVSLTFYMCIYKDKVYKYNKLER